MKILIIGAGEIGQALKKILAREVQMWDKDSAKVPGQKPLPEIIPVADFVFLCVPSFAIREVLTAIKPSLQPQTLVVSLAKGLENSGKTMAEILKEELPAGQQFGLLSGPMIAEEIMQDKKAFAVFATANQENFDKISPLFPEKSLGIIWSSDVQGAAVVSVLKNIYAILFGIFDGLNLGNNAKGALLVKTLEEMKKIISIFGGEEKTVESLAGLGDLLATATSEYSRNHQTGVEIVKTKTVKLVGEGAISFEALQKRLGDKTGQFPLLQILGEILKNPAEVKSLIKL